MYDLQKGFYASTTPLLDAASPVVAFPSTKTELTTGGFELIFCRMPFVGMFIAHCSVRPSLMLSEQLLLHLIHPAVQLAAQAGTSETHQGVAKGVLLPAWTWLTCHQMSDCQNMEDLLATLWIQVQTSQQLNGSLLVVVASRFLRHHVDANFNVT